MNFEYPLEISRKCLLLDAQTPVAGYGEAILAYHGNNCTAIIRQDLHTKIGVFSHGAWSD
jgi:hypothetical protein